MHRVVGPLDADNRYIRMHARKSVIHLEDGIKRIGEQQRSPIS